MNRGKARRRWSSLGSAALLAVVLSCSSGYDESVTADAGAEAGTDGPDGHVEPSKDAAKDARTEGPCDVSQAFTSVAPVPGITGEVGAMSLTDDELHVIVAVPRADSTEADIVELTRAERAAAFAVDKMHRSLSARRGQPATEGGLTLGLDGKTLTYVGLNQTIWTTQRKELSALFSSGSVSSELGDGSVLSVDLSHVTDTLWYRSRPPNSSEGVVLYRLAKVAGGYSQPSPAFPAGEGPYRANPTTTRDNLVMYFSDRIADAGTPLGVFRATRESTTSTFGPPTYVSELTEESGGSTVPVWLSGDRCRLYLLRSSSQGPYRAFVATRG